MVNKQEKNLQESLTFYIVPTNKKIYIFRRKSEIKEVGRAMLRNKIGAAKADETIIEIVKIGFIVVGFYVLLKMSGLVS